MNTIVLQPTDSADTTLSSLPENLKQRQALLRQRYQNDPTAAQVIDHAKTSSDRFSASNPLHTQVTVDSRNPTDIRIGVHQAVGGNSDAPTPGDLLCGALASCLDSTVRIIANVMGVELAELSVEVKGVVDVRGTLLVDKSVPVNFQRFSVIVDMGTKHPLAQQHRLALLKAAERSCIVMQTLKAGADIKVTLAG